jgi:cytochrome o ubiquinol oxidase subunit 3
MSAFQGTAGDDDPDRAGHASGGHSNGAPDSRPQDRGHTPGHAAGDLASKRIIVGYGFWIFLLSDIVMFSAFFATFAVLVGNTAGGPSGAQLFDLRDTAIETACLLLSSFTCGLASIGARMHNGFWFHGAMAVTFVLGAAFIGIELHEFADLVARGAGPSRSAFLSAFFTLVGCHGLHVSAGLLWLLTMMAQVFAKGYRPDILRRVLCFSLFWHTLDIIWVALFTVAYLMGTAR